MKRYGLIGFPLQHSFSKRYFSEKFKKENIDAIPMCLDLKIQSNHFYKRNTPKP